MIGYRDVKNLKYHAREIAMMMDTEDIEAVIAEFVAAKNLRDSHRNQDPK
jgi:hypothetical protein